MSKLILGLPIVLILFCSCQEKTDKLESGLSVIQLILSDYDSTSHKGFIDFQLENSVNPIKVQLKFNSEGKVDYSFLNNKKKEVVVRYDDREFSLIVSPGERLKLVIPAEELLSGMKLNEFVVSGVNKKTNSEILKSHSFLDSLINTSTSGFTKIPELNELNYPSHRLQQMKLQLQDFQLYIEKYDLKEETFIGWGKSKIIYSAGNDLSIYPFVGKFNPNIHHESDYFRFIRDLPGSGSDEIVFQSCLNYLKSLAMSFQIMSNISTQYEEERMRLRKESSTSFSIAFEMVKDLQDSKERQLLIAYLFNKNQHVPETFMDSLAKYVNDDLLSEVVFQEVYEKKSIFSLIEEYDISEKEKLELLNIYREANDKLVFHDFWFSSCPACIREFRYYNDLISSVDTSKVEFVFLGVSMNQKEWNLARNHYALNGKHYLLTKNQLAFYEKHFKIHGFPHHQIVEESGKINFKHILSINPSNFGSIQKLMQTITVSNNVQIQ